MGAARGIDFFDVDHTLTRRSSGGRFVSEAIRQGILPKRLALVLPWYSLTYRLGVFRPGGYEAGFPSMRGVSRSVLERLAHDSFERSLKADLFPQAVELVHELMRSGRRVMLATSSLDFIVRPLADFLRVDGVLATELEFLDDTCTGRFHGLPMFRAEKATRTLSLLHAEGVSASDCFFYSDSIYDLPLLEAVGHPVVVNPDLRLGRVARRRGWPIRKLG